MEIKEHGLICNICANSGKLVGVFVDERDALRHLIEVHGLDLFTVVPVLPKRKFNLDELLDEGGAVSEDVLPELGAVQDPDALQEHESSEDPPGDPAPPTKEEEFEPDEVREVIPKPVSPVPPRVLPKKRLHARGKLIQTKQG